LAPLAALALVVWYAAVAFPALLHGPWSRVRVAALLALPVLAAGVALVDQYHDVTSQLDGGSLLTQVGGTPVITDAMTAAAFVLVLATCFAYSPVQILPGRAPWRLSYRGPLAWLAGYVAIVTLADGWQTLAAPHYGSVKLLFVTVGALVALGVAELFASPAVATRGFEAVVLVSLATLLATVVQQGPLYSAAVAHWPKPVAPRAWLGSVDQLVATDGRVLCLGLTPKRVEDAASLDAYLCDRWVSSLQGLDDTPATTWRFVQLGRQPVSDAVAEVKAAHDKPWRILVIGTRKQFESSKGWWAPLAHLPGLTFVFSADRSG
jgi:hypothetical protein